MDPIIVTAAIIRNKEKILIAQRQELGEHHLQWEFPGGKLEIGETPEECLRREILEELNLKIKVLDIFKVVYHAYQNKTILLLSYICDLLGGEGEALACNDFQWIGLEDFKNYTYVEADLPIVEKILKYGDQIFEIDELGRTSYNRIGHKTIDGR
ncbi:8-oxo-dGTP diphosphatase [Geosporobacter subterraneus DSM 17957]|uniref:8-oxo-dGTP diphosphatase n=1 Tax=Geosporobacter subterraneus DSM 17957 TaxID=1121919 RepID=A0A1M6FUC7_9FIRM|nr:(deoxy)nucleoside triphosphate pyrophosphohydrolase [Geosporobacter subterraneus]SHJ01326.1 8-oxo-dGTP diphosphatase [Geosporobacter subterraneus DSM 17957]